MIILHGGCMSAPLSFAAAIDFAISLFLLLTFPTLYPAFLFGAHVLFTFGSPDVIDSYQSWICSFLPRMDFSCGISF